MASFIQLFAAVYPVGVTFLYAKKIGHNSAHLYRIVYKISTEMLFNEYIACTKFQLNRSMSSHFMPINGEC